MLFFKNVGPVLGPTTAEERVLGQASMRGKEDDGGTMYTRTISRARSDSRSAKTKRLDVHYKIRAHRTVSAFPANLGTGRGRGRSHDASIRPGRGAAAAAAAVRARADLGC